MGNVIEDEVAENSSITVEGDSFVSLLWIDGGGHCQICEEGMWISALSLSQHVGSQYSLHFSSDNNRLILGQSELTLNVTGCPAGFGAVSSNFTCSLCEVASFNIEDDFVRECLSCAPELNSG